jgi:N-acyl-D-amino-acid deacylase
VFLQVRVAEDRRLPANLESGGLGLRHYPVLNQDSGAVSQMLVNPNVLIGVADAGDHVGLIMEASQCTYVLHQCARHWVRDTGLLDVGRAVYKLSRRRRVVRLADRGVVAPGYFAHVNVVDRQGLEPQAPDMLSDLPLGRTASCNEPAATATPSSRAGPDRP